MTVLNEKVVTFLASQFGTPYPIPKGESLKYARVRVKIDITKKLQKSISVTLPSKKVIEAQLGYEKLPKLCFYCGFFWASHEAMSNCF